MLYNYEGNNIVYYAVVFSWLGEDEDAVLHSECIPITDWSRVPDGDDEYEDLSSSLEYFEWHYRVIDEMGQEFANAGKLETLAPPLRDIIFDAKQLSYETYVAMTEPDEIPVTFEEYKFPVME